MLLNEGKAKEKHQEIYKKNMKANLDTLKQLEKEFNEAKRTKNVKQMKKIFRKVRYMSNEISKKTNVQAAVAMAGGAALGGTVGSGGNVGIGLAMGAGAGVGNVIGKKAGMKAVQKNGLEPVRKAAHTKFVQTAGRMARDLAAVDPKFKNATSKINNESAEFDTHGDIDRTVNAINFYLEEFDILLTDEMIQESSVLDNFGEDNQNMFSEGKLVKKVYNWGHKKHYEFIKKSRHDFDYYKSKNDIKGAKRVYFNVRMMTEHIDVDVLRDTVGGAVNGALQNASRSGASAGDAVAGAVIGAAVTYGYHKGTEKLRKHNDVEDDRQFVIREYRKLLTYMSNELNRMEGKNDGKRKPGFL